MLYSRNPRREDHMTCTAVAPDVFTVRMYGTRLLYGPRLVRKFNSHEAKTSRSAPRHSGHSQVVAKLRRQHVPGPRRRCMRRVRGTALVPRRPVDSPAPLAREERISLGRAAPDVQLGLWHLIRAG